MRVMHWDRQRLAQLFTYNGCVCILFPDYCFLVGTERMDAMRMLICFFFLYHLFFDFYDEAIDKGNSLGMFAFAYKEYR